MHTRRDGLTVDKVGVEAHAEHFQAFSSLAKNVSGFCLRRGRWAATSLRSSRMAAADQLRPWLGDILKCPENGLPKRQNRLTFWPVTQAGENVSRWSVCPRFHE